MTEAEREKLDDLLKVLGDADAAIEKAMEPFCKAAAAIDEAREMLLEQHEAEIAGRCEGCNIILFVGDKGHAAEDGQILCAECAPSWGDVREQWTTLAIDPSDEEILAERVECLAAVDAHVAAGGSIDDKVLYDL